jgi:hypothetical protein
MIPTKGRIVLVEFLNDQPLCNNDRVHPAIVTNSFATEDGPQYINVKILTDGPQPALWVTSIGRKDRATPTIDADGKVWPQAVWYWPPKDGEAAADFAAPQVTENPVAGEVGNAGGSTPPIPGATAPAPQVTERPADALPPVAQPDAAASGNGSAGNRSAPDAVAVPQSSGADTTAGNDSGDGAGGDGASGADLLGTSATVDDGSAAGEKSAG